MNEDYVELRQIVKVLFKWWWILLLGILLGGVLSYNITRSQSEVYESTVTVMVGGLIDATEINRDDIAAQEIYAKTYADLVRRQLVLEMVNTSLDLKSPWQRLEDQVQVKIVEPQMIEITVQANNPQDAQLLANEIGLQLINLSPDKDNIDSTQQFLLEEIESLQSRIESGRNKLVYLQSSLLTTETSQEQLDIIRSEANALERLITDWETTYSRLLGLVIPINYQNSLTVIEKAQLNSSPIRPRMSLNLLVGIGAGFALSIGVIFLLDLFDDKSPSVKAHLMSAESKKNVEN